MSKKIVVRAYYRERPKVGYIRISHIVGLVPKQYQLNLYDENMGAVDSGKKFFPTVSAAIAHASLYGFSTHGWRLDEKIVG